MHLSVISIGPTAICIAFAWPVCLQLAYTSGYLFTINLLPVKHSFQQDFLMALGDNFVSDLIINSEGEILVC